MKELNNVNVYEFLQEEIALHPDLDAKFRGNLKEHKNDNEFWEELSEKLDCFTICDVCHKPMIVGYIMNGSHYCSETCLRTNYSEEEARKLLQEENDECYYTVWYENSTLYSR